MDSVPRWPHDAILHAWWVQPGRLLAGEYPGARTPEKTRQKVRLIVDAGVDSIVDLTTPDDGLDPYLAELQVAADKAGRRIRHYAYPIPDNGVISQNGYDNILTRIRDEIDSGRIVYLHCWGGKGRTTTVVGCVLIDGGLDYDAQSRASRSHGQGPVRPATHARSHRRNTGCCGSARLGFSERKNALPGPPFVCWKRRMK
jgi:hypothetical protein